jgi:hypothetical protein
MLFWWEITQKGKVKWGLALEKLSQARQKRQWRLQVEAVFWPWWTRKKELNWCQPEIPETSLLWVLGLVCWFFESVPPVRRLRLSSLISILLCILSVSLAKPPLPLDLSSLVKQECRAAIIKDWRQLKIYFLTVVEASCPRGPQGWFLLALSWACREHLYFSHTPLPFNMFFTPTSKNGELTSGTEPQQAAISASVTHGCVTNNSQTQ